MCGKKYHVWPCSPGCHDQACLNHMLATDQHTLGKDHQAGWGLGAKKL